MGQSCLCQKASQTLFDAQSLAILFLIPQYLRFLNELPGCTSQSEELSRENA